MKQKTNLNGRLNQLYGSLGYGASVQDTAAQIQTDLLEILLEHKLTVLDSDLAQPTDWFLAVSVEDIEKVIKEYTK